MTVYIKVSSCIVKVSYSQSQSIRGYSYFEDLHSNFNLTYDNSDDNDNNNNDINNDDNNDTTTTNNNNNSNNNNDHALQENYGLIIIPAEDLMIIS